ncbi:MAG: alanine--tRNA ligase [Nitrospirota bacterium]|nr:alanine--tRNA ligase [Nitrospirota bacterium]
MTSSEIRKTFLEFFRSKDHEVIQSSPLIPGNDPTLLFTNAGMVQFKTVFLGEEKRHFRRAASSQKCLRAGGKQSDLENVGHTSRHHTFFEMLGNFSFGDYFKKEAILFAWELLTEHFKLPKEKLWITIYEDDDESAELWKNITDVSIDRIVRLGAKDNFWQMGDTGPCGPCSEIIIDQGADIGCGRPGCAVGCDCDRYLELWNLVFMQYSRDKSGKLHPLPQPSIDTGMGLERIAAVLQGKSNNFDIDLFQPIISSICAHSKKSYSADRETDTAIRVVADHIRAITFLLAEGLVPLNEGRGYVLRRIIRRASRYTKMLGIDKPMLYRLCDSVAETMSDVYPEITEEMPRIRETLRVEEERFSKTLEQGLLLLNGIIKDAKNSGKNIIDGSDLFRLYDTYGFPLDIARDVAEENSLKIDEPGFHREMEIQKTKARASWTGEEAAVATVYRELSDKYKETEFLGYETLESDATVLAIIINGKTVDRIEAGSEGEILLDRTPFYAESGGQAGDTGVLRADNMTAVVSDTNKPFRGLFTHRVKVKKGAIEKGSGIHCSVDQGKRAATMRNHTATHLLHSALGNLLGGHIRQSGSYVSPERLRFDFTHFHSLDQETLDAIEDDVNRNILKNVKVDTSVLAKEEAIESGAVALFGEKYGDKVRVITIPGISSELCGGTHVGATGEIGLLKILSEGSVASGIRRIEAVTGDKAFSYLRNTEKELKKISEILKVSENPAERLTKTLSEMKELEKTVEKLKGKSAADNATKILENVRDINGVKVIAHRFDGMEQKDLRVMADNIRDRLRSGVVLLASVKGGQASMVAMVTKDLESRFNAGQILKNIAAAAGGRGGGKADLAQGGAKDIKKLDKALESLYDIIKAEESRQAETCS